MVDDMKHEKVLFLFFMFFLGLRKWLKAVRRVWKS